MLVDKQSELMTDLLFAVHQHGGDAVTRKPPILKRNESALTWEKGIAGLFDNP